MVSLEGDQLLGFLAARDIPRHAVGTLVGGDLLIALVVHRVNAHRIQLDGAHVDIKGFGRVGRVTFQVQLDRARAAAGAATLVEQVFRFHAVFVGNELAVMPAEQVFFIVAEQLGHAVVDEAEFTLQIQDVNQIGRVIHHVTVQPFGVRQTALDLGFLFFDARFVERISNGVFQLIEAVGFLEDVIGAEPHGLGHLVDRGLTTQHDHGGLNVVIANETEHLIAGFLRHVEVENNDLELALLDQRNRDFTVFGLGNIAPFPLE